MSWQEYIRIGINHHLLYRKVISGPEDHLNTLRELLSEKRLEILDLWIPEEDPHRSEESRLLRDCGKDIYYNVGTRKGKEPAHPATLSAARREYSLDFYKREISRGLEVGCRKIIANSGPDVPEDRSGAFEALVDFFCEICRFVPEDVLVMVEPTDRDTDKKKFIGPSSEAVRLCQRIHAAGCPNFASMVDMCHLPLMDETVDGAMRSSAGHIGHIHLGNCIPADRSNPLYGDKHPAWGLEGGVYGVPEIAALLRAGIDIGYFSTESRGSASFEMLAYEDATPLESVDRFFGTLQEAWGVVETNLDRSDG